MKYKYTRKELLEKLEKSFYSYMGGKEDFNSDLLAQKEDKKELKPHSKEFNKQLIKVLKNSTPSPLEIEEIEELGIETLVEPFDKFVSQDRINHSFMTKINKIIRNQKKLYQLIKEKL